jgi:hypothetical protein
MNQPNRAIVTITFIPAMRHHRVDFRGPRGDEETLYINETGCAWVPA